MVFTTRRIVSGPTCGLSGGIGLSPMSSGFCRPAYGYSRPTVSYGNPFFGSRPYCAPAYNYSPFYSSPRCYRYNPVGDVIAAGVIGALGIATLAGAIFGR